MKRKKLGTKTHCKNAKRLPLFDLRPKAYQKMKYHGIQFNLVKYDGVNLMELFDLLIKLK